MKVTNMPINPLPDIIPANPKGEPVDPKLMQVAKNFEGLFVDQMVTAMRKTVTPGGLVPQSEGEKIYQSMLDSRYAQQIADSGEIGLSKMIYQQLLQRR